MSLLRRHLSLLTAIWLLAELSLVASPLVFDCCAEFELAVVEGEGHHEEAGEDVCCQGLAPGQICPMHGHRGGKHASAAPADTEDRSDDCAMSALCLPPDITLVSLSTGAGEVPERQVLTLPLVAEPLASISQTAIRLSLPPDSPPPRA